MTVLQVAQAKELKETILYIEKFEMEKAKVAEDIKDIYAQAKAKGFDVKAMRKVIARRKKERELVEREDEIVETYEGAVLS